MRWTITPPEDIDVRGISDAANQAMLEAMQAGVQIMANDAKRAVARGPKTGRVYTRHGISHQASAPGEPPATDTGVLVNSISGDAELRGGVVLGAIRATAQYAAWLELGTRRMAARPFLVPAVERNRERVAQFVREAFARGFAGFARK